MVEERDTRKKTLVLLFPLKNFFHFDEPDAEFLHHDPQSRYRDVVRAIHAGVAGSDDHHHIFLLLLIPLFKRRLEIIEVCLDLLDQDGDVLPFPFRVDEKESFQESICAVVGVHLADFSNQYCPSNSTFFFFFNTKKKRDPTTSPNTSSNSKTESERSPLSTALTPEPPPSILSIKRQA